MTERDIKICVWANGQDDMETETFVKFVICQYFCDYVRLTNPSIYQLLTDFLLALKNKEKRGIVYFYKFHKIKDVSKYINQQRGFGCWKSSLMCFFKHNLWAKS